MRDAPGRGAVSALAPVSPLLLATAILITGNGLQQTLLPVRANLEEFGELAIGLLGSSYYVGFVVGCVLCGRIVQRVGHIRAFAALASIAGAVVLVHALAVEPTLWIALHGLTGFCFAGLYLVIESWLNDKASNDDRGLVMGAYTMIILFVTVVGQMALTLDDPARFPLFAVASMLISLAIVPLALASAPQPATVAQARLRPAKLYAISPIGIVGVFLAGCASGAFWSLAPSYAMADGGDSDDVAVFMSIAVLGGALAQWPVGRLSDRTDRRFVAVGACAVAAAGGVGLAALGFQRSPEVAALAALVGASAMPLYAICAAHAFDLVERGDFVEMSSGLLLANGIGGAAGPVAASLVMAAIGPEGLFVSTAMAHLALAAFVLWRLRRRPTAPEALRNAFDFAATAATTVSLHPGAKRPEPRGLNADDRPSA